MNTEELHPKPYSLSRLHREKTERSDVAGKEQWEKLVAVKDTGYRCLFPLACVVLT